MEDHLRLWLGNLPYVAQKTDVEELFVNNSIDVYASEAKVLLECVKNIDISIDPFTGRNPSYCFIDFHTAEDAENALRNMQGQDIRGRAVKLNYHTRKKPTQAIRDSKYVLDRWKQSGATPARWITPHEEGRRLYVGGLPKIPHQGSVNTTMRDIFKHYPLEAVSKIIWPHPSTRSKPGDRFYCFVDLSTADLAEDTARALNGVRGPHGGAYKIRVADRSCPRKVLREQFGDLSPREVTQKIVLPPRNLDADW